MCTDFKSVNRSIFFGGLCLNKAKKKKKISFYIKDANANYLKDYAEICVLISHLEDLQGSTEHWYSRLLTHMGMVNTQVLTSISSGKLETTVLSILSVSFM